MRHRSGYLIAVLAATLLATAAVPRPVELPVVDGKEALATVNGEPVTRDELELQIAAFHASMPLPGATAQRPDAAGVLQRMIRAKLIVQEARNIGLDRQPEVLSAVEVFEREQLRRMLYDHEIAGITRPDPARVERFYRKGVARYRISSVLLEREDAAEALAAMVRAGGDFDTLVREAIAAGRAKAGDDGVWLGEEEIRAEVRKVVVGMEPGQTSGPIRVGDDVTVVRLLETKAPEDPDARKRAEADALKEQKVEALRKFGESLKARYCAIDRKVFDGIDYDVPSPGFAVYLEDTRIVARVQGEEPITVAALTDALQRKFFHGTDSPSPKKRYAQRKAEVLDEILVRRAAVLEARRRKLDRSEAFRSSVRGFQDELLFGAFVRKVIDPDIRLDDAALRKHFDAHRTEYTSPQQVTLRALVFRRRKDADAALARLRQGAAFEWLRANAEGQLDPKADGRLMEFPAAPVAVADLPEGARKVLASAKAGDERLYEDPAGPCYVIQVREVLAPAVQPFEAVRGDIAAKLQGEERQRAVDDWAAKLRAAYEVKEFVDTEQLNRLLLEGTGAAK